MKLKLKQIMNIVFIKYIELIFKNILTKKAKNEMKWLLKSMSH